VTIDALPKGIDNDCLEHLEFVLYGGTQDSNVRSFAVPMEVDIIGRLKQPTVLVPISGVASLHQNHFFFALESGRCDEVYAFSPVFDRPVMKPLTVRKRKRALPPVNNP
jgi:hypothetical protein